MQREPGAPRDGDGGHARGNGGARVRARVVLGRGLRRRGESGGRHESQRSGRADGGRRFGAGGGDRTLDGGCARGRGCSRVGRHGDARGCARVRTHDDARVRTGFGACGRGGHGACSEARSEAREESGSQGLRGSQLRRRDVRGRREEENLVIPGDRPAIGGVGLGLRWEFLDELLEREANGVPAGVDFLEIAPENYLKRGGRYAEALDTLAARYSIVTHGLTLSLGGPDALDATYLADLRGFLGAVGTPWHSDHLCVGSVDGRAMHDLLPVSHKAASVARIADRIRAAQDRLGLPVAVENISYYWHPGRAEMGEAEFLSRVCEAADCGLLLDVNNAYVNAVNFGADVEAWMRAAPLGRVVQIHVAGHEWFHAREGGLGEVCAPGTPGALIVDTHGADTPDPVLSLLERVLRRTGPVPVVLERDQNIPPFEELLAEVERIRAVRDRVFAAPSPGSEAQIPAAAR